MKYLRGFNESVSIYNPEWEKLLPRIMVVLKGQDYGIDKWSYIKENVMLDADMLQITYGIDDDMAPDTFEIDIYFVKDDAYDERDDLTTVVKSDVLYYVKNIEKILPNLRLTVDITFGDEMACEFTIDRVNGVRLFQDTTYGSKFDPSNTIFAIGDESLKKFVEFLNRFNHGVDLKLDDFYFLQQN